MRNEGLHYRRAWVLSALLGISLASCDVLGPSVEHYVIRVDSIVAPQVVAANDTLSVRLHGMVGPNGCYGLERVEREVTASSLDLTFHGQHIVSSDVICTQAIVTMNHEEGVEPPLVGPFRIIVHQPDGSLRERVVAVE